ncbi:MAG: cyclic nucleotide-binding domain-containing protein [Spirochaetes bacterium]|nr:cyclic nucleotide-binding domain-containing protein [Spirochaetota bacterium]
MDKVSKKTEEIIKTLKEVPIFKPFSNKPEELLRIASIMDLKKAKKGEYIIKEGNEGDTLFILKSGAVNILKKTLEKEEYTVVRLESTKDSVLFFGELALLDNDRRSASVMADTDLELLTINRSNFIKLGNKYPHLGLLITREISKILASRLRKTNTDIITLFEALVQEVSGGSAL